jgi:hypothetical protein
LFIDSSSNLLIGLWFAYLLFSLNTVKVQP